MNIELKLAKGGGYIGIKSDTIIGYMENYDVYRDDIDRYVVLTTHGNYYVSSTSFDIVVGYCRGDS